MVDLTTISAAIAAAASAVGLFDKIADQVERVLTNRSEPSVPKEHRMQVQGTGTEIVSKSYGQVIQTITAQDLAKLPEAQLQHITVLEKSMQNHYEVWAQVYPQLALMADPVSQARVNQQLKGIVVGMKGDLDGILSFLESCGLHLDDHYMHIRHLVNQA